MARVIENNIGRKSVKLNIEDIFAIVETYKRICGCGQINYESVRRALSLEEFYLPLD